MAVTRQGQFIGAYGTQAGGAITFEWVPDPLVFSEKILDVRDSLDDRTIPLILSQEIIKQDIAENFASEHDPEQQPWAPWSTGGFYTDPATDRTRKVRGYADQVPKLTPAHSGRILDWTGRLREEATSDRAFVQISGKSVNDDSLFYDTNGLPPYWQFHQESSEEWREPGGVLPRRRFLGMSGEAELQILEVFDEWFQGIIELAVSKRGNIFIRRRSPSTGRFI